MDTVAVQPRRAERAGEPPLSIAMHDAARTMLRARKAAKAWFDADGLSEPAWNLMLALFAFEADGRRIHIGELGESVDIPRTTTIRSLTHLEARGLVRLTRDASDRRAVSVQLTPAGRDAIQRALQAAFQLREESVSSTSRVLG